MLFGNTQNINNSKYEIFIICSCERLLGNILLLFLCPQCFFSGKGKKVEYFKGCGKQDNWGVNSCTFWSFCHSLTHPIWAMDLILVEKPKHVHLEVMGLFSLQVMAVIIKALDLGNAGLFPGLGNFPVLGSRRWGITIRRWGCILLPFQGLGCSHQSCSCNVLWKGAVYMHISAPLVTMEEGFSLFLASLRCQAYWIIELFCSFEHAFKIGTI